MADLLKKYQRYLVGLALVLIGILCLWIRLNPLSHLQTMAGGDPLNLSASDDPLYNFRQVELIIRHFPAYPWFDPMTLYPVGQTIYWGPLFPTIAALVCMILGMTSRPDIIFISQLIPPAMATAMVPVVYLIGKRMADWRTGLLAALFMVIVPGQYLQRSLFGYFDHHIAEVLFSTLFCLCYISMLVYTKRHPVDFRKPESLRIPVILSLLAAVAYLLGLFTMPTMILFALIVAAFTVVQYLWDYFRDRPSDYLLLANTIIFGVAIVGMLAFGIKHPGLVLSRYTIGHIYAYLMVIIATLFLAGHARYMKGRPWYHYLLSLAGVAVAGVVVLALVVPDIYSILIASLFSFFGTYATTLTVQEARPWEWDLAWYTFQYGLVLMALGMLAVVYKNWREEHPDQIFVLVWSLIILFATVQHVRYEYYLAVNVAILSGFIAGMVIFWKFDIRKMTVLAGINLVALLALFMNKIDFNVFWGFIAFIIVFIIECLALWMWTKKEEKLTKSQGPSDQQGKKASARKEVRARKDSKLKKEKKVEKTSLDSWMNIAVGVFGVAGIMVLVSFFIASSCQYDSRYSQGTIMNGDWTEALEWMGNNTPSPVVDYYGIFDKTGYTYPPGSYGVMSWWDYGHQITFIAKRIPNANPFQAGVAGPTGAASYFMTRSEEYANSVADKLGTRYVVTDIEMDSPKFWAMATWFNSSVNDTAYNPAYYVPGDTTGQYQLVKLNNQSYYETMVSRLHNFDGSMAVPLQVYYIEYQLPEVTGLDEPLITQAQILSAGDAANRTAQFNRNAPQGNLANVVSQAVFLPVQTVPALRHYRLVHESPVGVFTNTSATVPDLKYVKVFEYVKGARISGQGVIAIDLVTNQGRQFTYRQESVNGQFVVPYSTQGNPYQVQAISRYRIEGTSRTIEVPENAVMQGLAV